MEEYLTRQLLEDTYRSDMKRTYEEPRTFEHLPNYSRRDLPRQTLSVEHQMEQGYGRPYRVGLVSGPDTSTSSAASDSDMAAQLDDISNSLSIMYILLIILIIIAVINFAVVGSLVVHAWMKRHQ